jgi:hypothetical protein
MCCLTVISLCIEGFNHVNVKGLDGFLGENIERSREEYEIQPTELLNDEPD